jgi:Protein of unknown function (DUF3102)
MSGELQAQFVDQSIIDHINRRHRRIMELGKQALDEAIDIGRDLSEIKASLDHGQWLPWLEKNAAFTARSATRYMRLWDNRDRLKSDNVSDLSEAYALLSEPKKAKKTPTDPVVVDAEIVRFEPTPASKSWTRSGPTEPSSSNELSIFSGTEDTTVFIESLKIVERLEAMAGETDCAMNIVTVAHIRQAVEFYNNKLKQAYLQERAEQEEAR